jgi:tight adherence protein C
MNPIANIMTGLTDRFGPMGPLLAVGLLGMLLILLALPIVMKRQRDRFRELKDQVPGAGVADKKRALRRTERMDKLEKFAHFLEPQKKEELSAARLRMLRAGYTSKDSVRMYYAIQIIMAVSFFVLGLTYGIVKSLNQDMTVIGILLYGLVAGLIGYYIPRYWVNRRLKQRQTEIIQGFPDALDMMLVCVEAGQSLDQSIIRVGKESRMGYPALADEFDLVAQEMKAGKERVSVLKDMSERVGIPDVASFVTTIIQSATFGTSVADALRVYSADMRDKRIMRAEEKANMLPTKLTLGTMLFTVPPLLVILIGPSIHGMVVTLFEMRAQM